jgi:hypothetical protein
MKLTHYLKITVTRSRLLRLSVIPLRAYCPVCVREVETLSAAQAAEVLAVAAPQLDQFIAAGQVHAIVTVSASLRICQNSLFPTEEVR